ncbi:MULTISPECIES: DUF3298 and DUF4163 domain-containing protein [Aneurinibacillus]|uniref:DUF3298 and DUF4163 domain-containing protein n=1 Tax=Aneurinibacillus thermoaerophilus TaxID=143495 RepID=A0ABX8YCH0_ANETH|nr:MULTISPECIES: DUF3298 and DUF4163 domain-containing protein [Aneurinibacillus]AMA74004.1 hypothetical protein ACH33_14935 [Aneurinibacillus sp. XH2]MED0737621.1 DUF3298 and DUF4163 domain-containing protein [Aneurinibacillus thermoaerophilus]QYY43411.1 DUF3298 and DUF4163 domain-containing protein [Aneurinibacillus thermoaerophilus]
MKKFIAFALTFLLLTGTYIGLVPNYSSVSAASKISTVKITKKKEKINLKYVEGDIEYPYISGLSNAKIQSSINTLFFNHVQQRKKYAQKVNAKGPDPFMKDHKYNVSTTYEVSRNKNGIISVVFTDSEYLGGAHGMYDLIAYNINVNTGKVYNLKDLFKKNTNYVSLLSNEIKKQVKAKDKYQFDLSSFKNIKQNQRFYLTDKGIVIYFSLYEYTSYAAGIPRFTIPYTTVKKYLNISKL